ncbi:penicillin acylase family protein [Streptomyces anulatus]|uniref:penicillin acylase family protein n=1 Tax=Streptomyces anulatus TaxID=1892 RepID=UPI00224DE97D|nr:penicillin acylase family protein [Streptomyces anulatus]MCX4521960.1 penicillin acylase family protein [Streptomyces anulatus]MCX4604836.1 penicillin acylase family protein [Streptomyces anulatus]WTE29659.1 penicillin acylase family protein [Streptomyces anulatus]
MAPTDGSRLARTLASPYGPVEVEYDIRERPTVRAPDWTAAAFGLGWVTARHRRAQMELLWRRSHGRLAEVAGPSALPGDIRQRTLDLAGVARECWLLLPEEEQQMLSAYAAGVNLATERAEPRVSGAGAPDVTPWVPLHSIAVAQAMFQELASDGSDNRMVEVMRRTLSETVVDFLLDPRDEYATEADGSPVEGPRTAPLPMAELRALMAEPPDGSGRLVVADGRAVGSNAWATARDGRTVLANDMHLELTRPSLMYAVRLTVPGRTVQGVTVPGLPVLVSGTNGSVAWGFTRLPADSCDLTELEPGGSGAHLRGGGEEATRTRTERIAVHGAYDHALEVVDTPWGSVVGRLGDADIAFSATYTDPAALDFSAWRLYETDSVAAAADVVNDSGLPALNAVLADLHGDICWTVAGRYPRGRTGAPRGFADREPARGPDSWVPPYRLPRLLSPASGVVVSCNNGNTLIREAGLGWNLFTGVRARRVATRIANGHGTDEAGALELQLDLDAGLYCFYRALALRYLGLGHLPAPLEALKAEVSAWRGSSHRDEGGLALLVVFRELLREEMFAAATRPCQRHDPSFRYCYNAHEGPLRALLAALDEGLVPAPWKSARQFVVAQLGLARQLLTAHTGDTAPVRWGAANMLAATLSGTSASTALVELSGCADSVRVAQPDFGAAMRFVVDPARPHRALLGLPGSQSGREPSETKALLDWASGETPPLLPDPARPRHEAATSPHHRSGDALRRDA